VGRSTRPRQQYDTAATVTTVSRIVEPASSAAITSTLDGSAAVPPPAYVVLLPFNRTPATAAATSAGASATLFGEPVHARNARVAARAGAPVIDAAAAAELAGGTRLGGVAPVPVLVVPPTAAINLEVFPLGGPGFFQAQPGLGTPDAVLDLSTPSARRRAAWRIVRRTGKPADGWVSTHLNRPISRLFSYVLLQRGLRASHASAATMVVGLVTAVVAAQPGYLPLVATGLLYHLVSVLDGVDGEIARATVTESAAGAHTDTVLDQITHFACFVGITIGWTREVGAAYAAGWTLAVGAALVFTFWRGRQFVAKYAPTASFSFIDTAVRRAARDSGLLPLRLAAGVFALFRRDLMALLFVFVALAGERAAFPAFVAAGVIVANLTFSLYRRELVAAALAQRSS
jgi:phosphatidylglycerophosphate synthase